jgi:hypothetical protein
MLQLVFFSFTLVLHIRLAIFVDKPLYNKSLGCLVLQKKSALFNIRAVTQRFCPPFVFCTAFFDTIAVENIPDSG